MLGAAILQMGLRCQDRGKGMHRHSGLGRYFKQGRDSIRGQTCAFQTSGDMVVFLKEITASSFKRGASFLGLKTEVWEFGDGAEID